MRHSPVSVVKFGTERLLQITREEIDQRIQQFLVDFDIELVEG